MITDGPHVPPVMLLQQPDDLPDLQCHNSSIIGALGPAVPKGFQGLQHHRRLLDHLDPVPLEALDFPRPVGQQPDAPQTEIGPRRYPSRTATCLLPSRARPSATACPNRSDARYTSTPLPFSEIVAARCARRGCNRSPRNETRLRKRSARASRGAGFSLRGTSVPHGSSDIHRPLGRDLEDHTVENMDQPVIVRDPEVMHGTPCFRGTRVPFKNLIDYLEGDHSLNEFLGQFPTVTREMAIQALEEAKESLLARVA